ncbi:MAG: hypothetical protein NTX50_05830 [Candidatus Sumerlaeota bacterium]|nr:hypothetical protein [Candidatus Sumerlaeota bacterium]
MIYSPDSEKLVADKKYIFFINHSMLKYLHVIREKEDLSPIMEYNEENEKNLLKLM